MSSYKFLIFTFIFYVVKCIEKYRKLHLKSFLVLYLNGFNVLYTRHTVVNMKLETNFAVINAIREHYNYVHII